MSKKMTPCEKLGYKVGDKFTVIKDSYFEKGTIVVLSEDDRSNIPLFACGNERRYLIVGGNSDVKPISKPKPAKQALADAIHQNGGWRGGKYAVYGKRGGKCSFLTCKPQYLPKDHGWFVRLSWIVGEFEMKPFINWHQCILSRDEYFTAYPEHKVEAEMKSESEMTIKASDWHKNGELPPVGEACEAYIDYPPQWIETEIVAHKDGFAIGWCKGVMKGCHGDKAHEFRPLRTEREKAIDEMKQVCPHHGCWDNVGRIYAEALYDAGYRKEVE